MDGQNRIESDGWMELVKTEGWMDGTGCMDRWMGLVRIGWMDSWMDKWMN